MKKTILTLGIAISLFSITGCFEKEQEIKTYEANVKTSKDIVINQEKVEKNKEIINNIIKESFHISYGNGNDPTVIFFDPQCIHCHHLFENTQREEFKNNKFIWIPIGYLNDKSVYQSESILASSDPQATLIEHEKLYGTNGFGIEKSTTISDEVKEQVKTNNRLFVDTKFNGVPVLIRLKKDGQIIVAKGGLPLENIKDYLSQ